MAAARAAPLARRKALLVAMLIDAYLDRLFAVGDGGDDILEFRAAMARRSSPLARIMAPCSARPDVQLVIEAVKIAIADYGKLGVEDFMVSLYNDHSVQRLLLVDADGTRHDMIETMTTAIAALDVPA